MISIEVQKQNLLWIGQDNPLRIVVCGIDDISVTIDNGTISHFKGPLYDVKPEKVGMATISIYQKAQGADSVLIGKKLFRVRTIPKDTF